MPGGCVARLAGCVAAFAFSASEGVAQQARHDYPTRPIRLIAPSPPSGVHDVIGRLWAERIKSLLGIVVVENKPGAGTLIGVAEVVKAEPDGYTLLLGSTSSHVIAPALMARKTFDPDRTSPRSR
jgi:tripartite-type tricarboxylate transporter receptor subunit TctC